jgi:ABC-type oligopeptide transport system substrate-binding subunit
MSRRTLLTLSPFYLFTLSSLLLAGLVVVSGWSPSRAGQDKGKPPPKKEEEEETAPKPKRRVPLVGDEEKEEKTERSLVRSAAAVADLGEEAERTKSVFARQLFQKLARPYDLLTYPSGNSVRVAPIAEYIGLEPSFNGRVSVTILSEQGKPRPAVRMAKEEIKSVNPYEKIALSEVEAFLKAGQDSSQTAGPKYLADFEVLQDAEKVLAFVLRYHESARERGLRRGDGWKTLEDSLRVRLRDIQLKELRALTEGKDWMGAFALGTSLADRYRNDDQFRSSVADLLAQHADQALKSEDYNVTRLRLKLLEQCFPDNNLAFEPVREGLKKKALELLTQAQKEEKDGNTQSAMELLTKAEHIYPQLPGLRNSMLRLSNKYPILYVGVSQLPEYLSPARACTDSEKQAVELQFESLVKPVFSPGEGERFEPCLAEDMPQLAPLGRTFELIRNAYWSDGKRLTATDVHHTVHLLSADNYPGRNPEWAALMGQGARLRFDQYHITLTLRQGYLDPMAMMDFKILPESLQRADDEPFAKKPIGSGPYQLDPEKTRPGKEVVFVANPYYETRTGKAGLPHIRELHFVVSTSPIEDFQAGRLQLLLDLATRRLKELKIQFPTVDVRDQTLTNRRVFFLAVNHRRQALRNTALRRAIAHAINREEILNEQFRCGNPTLHRALNGPYPPGSWAYLNKAGLKSDPFELPLAMAQANKAKEDQSTLGKLTLKYPDGDPDVAQACERIRKQVQQAGIELDLVKRSPHELHRDVEQTHEYDLAYYHYDYPDETYWLWPLFDPSAANPGGPNYLGYQNDDILAALFRRCMTRREFKVIQENTHEIHRLLYEQMPLIPLWQLDRHFAYHSSLLMTGRIDPLLIFSDVEKWTLEKH